MSIRSISSALALTALLHAPAVAAGAPAIVLGQTVPEGTALGDPSLPNARSEWVAMIDGAKRSLDLEHFYLSHEPGEALQPVLDAIGRAAARGVRVRLLLDARMGRTYPQPADSLDGLPGVEVRRVDYGRIAGGVQHAKFMVVDGREAWLGSQNLDWRALSHIHELGVRIRLPQVVGAMADIFTTDWSAADTTRPAVPITTLGARRRWPERFTLDHERGEAWLSASPRSMNPEGVPWDEDVLLARIRAARREIVWQVLQYGVRSRGQTDSTLHQALVQAAGRGVKVRAIVSDWVVGDSGEKDLRSLAEVPGIEVRISRIPDDPRGYIPFARVEHNKMMVVDSEWTWIGTSNWEPGYFTGSRNMALTLRHRGLARTVRGIFQTSWDAPSALRLTRDLDLQPRTRRETPPPGMRLFKGR